MLAVLTEQLLQGQALAPSQVITAVEVLTHPDVDPAIKADFLGALAKKGETVEEISVFASLLRDRALRPELEASLRSRVIVDVCGTGGDRLNTFNISTTVALVVAAAGVPVAKHGNRAITSQSGSADVLEALGIRIDLPPAQAANMLASHGFAFFFAPNYHPAFKAIGPARTLCAERGQPTIFNFLGPLLNPVRPSAQLMGVARPELCEPLALVLQSLGTQRGMVVCGSAPGKGAADAHLDELSTMGSTFLAEFYQERGFHASTLDLADLGLKPARLEDLHGGDRETNARIIERILTNQDRGPKRDAVLLNAGAALLVAGTATSLAEGMEQASSVLDDGRAQAKLETLRKASHS